MLCECQSCYFNKDSTEVTSGFPAVTSVPHLNDPPERVKTGRQFLCKRREGETKKERQKERQKERREKRWLDWWMETCGLFLSSPKQPSSNHTLSGIPAAKIFHVMFLKEQFTFTVTCSMFSYLKRLCCRKACMWDLMQPCCMYRLYFCSKKHWYCWLMLHTENIYK